MSGLHLIPVGISLQFIPKRKMFFIASAVIIIASIFLFLGKSLNYGIDFKGGIMIEVKTQGPANIGAMRETLSGLGLGAVELQEFGAVDTVLIRVQRQPGGDQA